MPGNVFRERRVDPVTLEVIRYGLVAIMDQIETDITRTAYSPLIYEYKDYCVALLDAEGGIIAQSRGSLPIFLADLGTPIQEAIKTYGYEGIHPGDIFLINAADPLGQHLNNVVTFTPAFHGDQLIGFAAVRTHWMDLGGRDVGSCSTNMTTDIYQEGIQYPIVKLFSRGAVVDDMMRLVLLNTRFRRMVEGDLNAQLAGCIKGRRLFEELAARYGADTVSGAVQEIWERSERKARDAVRAIPDGEYRAESFVDDDGRPSSPPVHIRVRVVVKDDEMTIDLSGLDPQVQGALNAGRYGGGYTAAKLAFKYLTTPFEIVDEGSFRPLHIDLPDGTFLSAKPPAAMARFNVAIPTVIDTVLKALAPAIPNRLAAGHHGSYGSYQFVGHQPDTAELYKHLDTAPGGWGGTHNQDGFSPLKTMVHGDTRDIPVEVQEAFYPLRVERYSLRTDSAGPGRQRGGLGTEKVYRVLHPCAVTVTMDRTKCPPWGLFGGKAAQVGGADIVPEPGAAMFRVSKNTNQPLAVGGSVAMLAGGGGGYGDPWERDPAMVERDVQFGYVSREAAATDYGCVIDLATGCLDRGATERLRTEHRAVDAAQKGGGAGG